MAEDSPGYEGEAQEREPVDEEGRGVGDATAAIEDGKQGGQVCGGLDQAGQAEVEVEAGPGPGDLPHVERQTVEGEGADKPVVVEDQGLGPHVGTHQQVKKILLPPNFLLSLVDRSQIKVSGKRYFVVKGGFLDNFFCLGDSAH